MKRIAALLLFLVVSHASAVDELGKLKASYESAVAKATAPIRAMYEKELQRLLERYTKAGNLDEAAKVIAELKGTGATVEAASTAAPAAAASGAAAPAVNERWFVNKTWKSPTGTLFAFQKGGVGKRSFGTDETGFVWRALPDGLIEVSGESNKGGPMQIRLFRFVNSDEAYYGTSKDNMGAKITRE